MNGPSKTTVSKAATAAVNNRVDETLQTLFESLFSLDTVDPDDTKYLADAQALIQEIKRSVHTDGADANPPHDVNQAQDLIKRKLLRENASPEKASRFSNLYSRLLGTTVLSQKWAMLYLLYSLAGTEPSGERDDRAHRYAEEEREDEEEPEEGDLGDSGSSRFEGPRHDPAQDHLHFGSRHFGNEKDEQKLQYPHPRANGAGLTKDSLAPKEKHGRTPGVLDAPRSTLEYRANGNQVPVQQGPSEFELLRDLPFNLQGLSSTTLTFISSTTVKLPSTLPIPMLSLIHTLAEPCLLYKVLSGFTTSQHDGLISQSLSAAISNELRAYLGLVATLEGEIRRALTAIEKGDSDRKTVRAAGVTLKRCVIWTRDATMGLRLMSLIVEESRTRRGGQIITLVHNLSSSHGDPFVGTFAKRLLTNVARPFYEMLRHWIYDGELVDPYNEFFVVESDPNAKADVDPRRVATSIWEDKYTLEDVMIPTIISAEFAKKVFLTGKSLNFIRHNCGDSDWVIQYSQTHSKPLDYANTTILFSSIDDAYQSTMSRLTYLMANKFLLFTHLHAIKKYLLLSQGDFIELLVESLAPNLDRPAHSQYRHTLTSQLEHAIRHSNAQYEEPEVLKRLDARMLELGRGDTGWDCFTLEYKVSPPCDVVITQWASTQYLKIFNLLLRIKRVEYSLNTTWRRCMTGARGVLATVGDQLNEEWKRARCVVAAMVHFVNQLQYYILFEVIEASWERLQEAVKKPNATLDDLIDAHTQYVRTITQKGLLSSTADREEAFLVQLHHILRCMLNYRDAVDGLYSHSVAEFTKRQQFTAKIEQRTAAGKWGITEKDLISGSRSDTPVSHSAGALPGRSLSTDDPLDSPLLATGKFGVGDDAVVLTSIRSRLLQLDTEFKSRISVMLYDLGHQPDVDMRFLGVVMNFNEVYKPVNRRRREREKEKREARTKQQESSSIGAGTSVIGNGIADGT